jgi:hypothetical protein
VSVNNPKRLRSGAVVRRSPFPQRTCELAAFSASHATLDPDHACNAAQDGTLWLSKAAIRPTQTMKAGDTFLFFTSAASCSVQVCRAPSRPVSVGKETSSPHVLSKERLKRGWAVAPAYVSSAQASEGTQNYTSVQYRGTTVGAVAHRIGDMRSSPQYASLRYTRHPEFSGKIDLTQLGGCRMQECRFRSKADMTFCGANVRF